MTHIINPNITSSQKNIVIGTILGGSSIVKPSKGKNCYLSMRSKNINWLRYKATELENLSTTKPIIVEKTNRWHSICYPFFNKYRDLFYEENDRKLSSDILDLLQAKSIAIWFGDCGKFKKNQLVLNTHIWKKEGTELIHQWMCALEWDSKIFLERKLVFFDKQFFAVNAILELKLILELNIKFSS